VFGVILGTGVGGGIVVDGRLLRGADAIAGEWGHNPLAGEPPGRPAPACYCGRQGCVETYLSGPALAADYRVRGGAELAVPAMIARMRRGERLAGECWQRYLDRLARALGAVVNILDPHVIVLGGGLSAIPELYAALPPRLVRHVFSDRLAARIVPPVHGAASGVRGAGAPVGRGADMNRALLSWAGLRVFLPYALGFYLSYLLRMANAVLTPELSRDLGISAAELGLVTSAYFLSFAAFQLPLGMLLDRFGPRRVNALLLLFAAAGCAGFGAARDLPGLLAAPRADRLRRLGLSDGGVQVLATVVSGRATAQSGHRDDDLRRAGVRCRRACRSSWRCPRSAGAASISPWHWPNCCWPACCWRRRTTATRSPQTASGPRSRAPRPS
jgi:hypothetical protein